MRLIDLVNYVKCPFCTTDNTINVNSLFGITRIIFSNDDLFLNFSQLCKYDKHNTYLAEHLSDDYSLHRLSAAISHNAITKKKEIFLQLDDDRRTRQEYELSDLTIESLSSMIPMNVFYNNYKKNKKIVFNSKCKHGTEFHFTFGTPENYEFYKNINLFDLDVNNLAIHDFSCKNDFYFYASDPVEGSPGIYNLFATEAGLGYMAYSKKVLRETKPVGQYNFEDFKKQLNKQESLVIYG